MPLLPFCLLETRKQFAENPHPEGHVERKQKDEIIFSVEKKIEATEMKEERLLYF